MSEFRSISGSLRVYGAGPDTWFWAVILLLLLIALRIGCVVQINDRRYEIRISFGTAGTPATTETR